MKLASTIDIYAQFAQENLWLGLTNTVTKIDTTTKNSELSNFYMNLKRGPKRPGYLKGGKKNCLRCDSKVVCTRSKYVSPIKTAVRVSSLQPLQSTHINTFPRGNAKY